MPIARPRDRNPTVRDSGRQPGWGPGFSLSKSFQVPDFYITC